MWKCFFSIRPKRWTRNSTSPVRFSLLYNPRDGRIIKFSMFISRTFATVQEFPAKDILKDASQISPPETSKIDAALDLANWSVKKFGRVTLKHIQAIVESMKSGLTFVLPHILVLITNYVCEWNRTNFSPAELASHPLPWRYIG